MPSLSASIFGFATGIANADKIDVVTSTHAARPIKSRRRIGGPSLGRPHFTAQEECFEGPTVPRNVTWRLHWRSTASDLRRSRFRKGATSRTRRYFGGRSSPLIQPDALSDLSGSASSQFSHCNVRPLGPEGSTKVMLPPHFGQGGRSVCPMACIWHQIHWPVHSKGNSAGRIIFPRMELPPSS
jgi:hypothetical protein